MGISVKAGERCRQGSTASETARNSEHSRGGESEHRSLLYIRIVHGEERSEIPKDARTMTTSPKPSAQRRMDLRCRP